MRSARSKTITSWPARELLRGGEAGRPRADDGDPLAGPLRGRLGQDPALREGVIDDRHLDLLDGDRQVVDAEHARGLARRGAEPAGELREVVGGVQRAAASRQRSR